MSNGRSIREEAELTFGQHCVEVLTHLLLFKMIHFKSLGKALKKIGGDFVLFLLNIIFISFFFIIIPLAAYLRGKYAKKVLAAYPTPEYGSEWKKKWKTEL